MFLLRASSAIQRHRAALKTETGDASGCETATKLAAARCANDGWPGPTVPASSARSTRPTTARATAGRSCQSPDGCREKLCVPQHSLCPPAFPQHSVPSIPANFLGRPSLVTVPNCSLRLAGLSTEHLSMRTIALACSMFRPWSGQVSLGQGCEARNLAFDPVIVASQLLGDQLGDLRGDFYSGSRVQKQYS